MEQVGPYRLLGKLGEGAMGVVYRARGPGGPEVALKTVLVDGEAELEAMRREIGALARLRHPAIARILDHGVHGDRPWYAMELVDGEPLGLVARRITGSTAGSGQLTAGTFDPVGSGSVDVEELLEGGSEPPRDLGARPPAAGGQLNEALALIRALCDPLAWLHGEGVVHRDLKPSNVLVVEGNRPILVDFGLAGRFSAGGRERLRVERHRAGTVGYMAPEQIRGDTVDARADLYALGCMLYELVCGRPPFTSTSPAAVLQGHLSGTVYPTDMRVEGVPPALDELILRLLAKDPSDRIGYADLVAAKLEELGAPAPPPTDRKPRAYLYSGRFSGRDRDLQRAEAALERNGLVLIGAESGAGKTRVAAELANRVRSTHRVELAECVPLGTEDGADGHGGPLYPFAPLLRTAADAIRTGRMAPLDAETEALRSFLPGLTTGPTPEGTIGAAHRVLRALTALLARLDPTRPTLLVLDDLQWADALTLEWVGAVARTRPAGLSLLGTYRVEEVGDVLADVLGDCGDAVLELPALDQAAVGAMVRDMLALEAPPTDFVRFLLRTSGGNPFFVTEYLRTAIAEGLMFRDERGRWHVLSDVNEEARPEHFEQMALPDSLRAVVGRRIAGLSTRARTVAGQLAAIGREARRAELAHACGPCDDAIAELVSRRICEESGGKVRFLHDKLREASYAAIQSGQRSAVHRAAADAIEAFATDPEAAAAAIAWHLERGRRPAEARAWYLRAAALAARRHAPRDADRLFAAGFALPSVDDEAGIAARVAWSRQARIAGRFDVALREAELAAAQALSASLMVLASAALRAVAAAHIAGGKLDDAKASLERAVALGPSHDDAREQAGAWLDLADCLRVQGHLDSAERALASAEGLVQGVQEVQLSRLLSLARIRYDRGEHQAALADYDRGNELARHLGEPIGQANAQNGRANCLSALERPDEAMAAYEASLALHRRVGNLQGEAVALSNIAIQFDHAGDPATAEARHAVAVGIFREMGAWRFCGHALCMMAGYARHLGHHDVALSRAKESILLLERVGDVPWLTKAREEARLATDALASP